MRASSFYNKILTSGVSFECSCENISIHQWNSLMNEAKRANKKIINKVVKDFFKDWDLNKNPYNYYRTKTHIIVIHSAIEYFFSIN